MTLPYADPHAPRGVVRRVLVAAASSRLVARLSRSKAWRMTVWRIDPHVLRLTHGRVSVTLGVVPTALLQTQGARTGLPRRNGVIYFHDGERVTLVASKAGRPEHPAWFHNARAHPEVLLGGQPFTAAVVEDEAEQARLWELADRVFGAFPGYRETAARSGRTIPILQLTPR